MTSESSPLARRVIALTRPRDRIAPLAAAFVDAGAETILLPVLRLIPVEGRERTELEETIRVFSEAGRGWWGLTSGSVVPTVVSILAADPDLAQLVREHVQIAAVGEATAAAARSRGLTVTFIGDGSGGVALAEGILAIDPVARVLHLTSDRGLPALVETIDAGGGSALRAVAVEHRVEPTLDPGVLFLPPAAEMVVFASPSAAEALLRTCDADERVRLIALPVLAIGETTSAALTALGFTDVTASVHPTAESLVEAAAGRFGGSS